MLIALLVVSQRNAYGQDRAYASLKGKVFNKETGEVEIGCAVVIAELNLWSVSNQDGVYSIDKIPVGGTYSIKTSSLGFEPLETRISFGAAKEYHLDLSLLRTSFEMEEVVVLAEEKKGLGSSSTIGKEAMEHLQPSSLKDVMQLLPGQISTNPDLSKKAQISIRDIEGDANSSLGTSIIVDGAPISNNADMQTRSTSYSSVDGGGIDVRQITTSNIESIEVIRGIASAEYGDMTSGLVVVKTKAGATPLNAKVSINPNIKSTYLGKGLRLPGNGGALNLDLDYTSSIKSRIKPYEGFKRLSGQLGYSSTFFKLSPLSLNLTAKYYQTIASKKSDPDFISRNEEYRSSEKGLRFTAYGKWNLKKALVTNLDYHFSISSIYQELYSREVISLGYIQPISNARKDTLMEGVYAPSEYFSEMTVDGRPVYIYGKLSAKKVIRKGETINRILYGVDFRSSGNNGKGRIYDEYRPPRLSGGSGTRPRPYTDIPALRQFSAFLSDNLTLFIGETNLMLEAGLRFNNYQPLSLFKSEVDLSMEPRVNLRYEFLNSANNQYFDKFALFGGFGIHSKSPTSVHLYPDLAYFDLNSFNYFAADPNERLLLVTTRVFDTGNPELKPSKSYKYEAGLEAAVKKMTLKLNAYHERLENGFSFVTEAKFSEFYRWTSDDPNIVFNPGSPPVVDLHLPTEIDTFICVFRRPDNSRTFVKRGIEYVVNFGTIKAIRTRLNLSGAYMQTRSYSNKESKSLPLGNGAVQLPWLGVYPKGSGSERVRFNSNLTAVTHIPKLRLVFSTTIQLIWKNSYRVFLGGGQPWDYQRGDQTYLVKAPLALIDKAGNRRDFTREEILTQPYDSYLSKYQEQYFLTQNPPVHYQLNLKVTSEIGKSARFSFFANNLTMHNPKYRSQRTNSVKNLNSKLYFGLELTLTI
ncbi:MAG: hypothetical protein CSA96_04145 [Bacteroidetes bacterium]|nr:MAG: hypothetical protein CSA96_04145 [Bacteroidota bacterium]